MVMKKKVEDTKATPVKKAAVVKEVAKKVVKAAEKDDSKKFLGEIELLKLTLAISEVDACKKDKEILNFHMKELNERIKVLDEATKIKGEAAQAFINEISQTYELVGHWNFNKDTGEIVLTDS